MRCKDKQGRNRGHVVFQGATRVSVRVQPKADSHYMKSASGEALSVPVSASHQRRAPAAYVHGDRRLSAVHAP